MAATFTIIGYAASYEQGRELARLKGYAFAYVVASNEAPLRYTVMV